MFKKFSIFTLITLAGMASAQSSIITFGAYKTIATQKESKSILEAPVLINATTNGTRTLVKGKLNGSQAGTVIIQFFSNPINRNPITEGKFFLGQITLKKGKKSFRACLPCTNEGSFISATATRLDKKDLSDTSKFSLNVAVTA